MIIEKSFFDRLKQIYLVEEFCGYTDEDIDYIKSLFGDIPKALEEYYRKAGRTEAFQRVQDTWLLPEHFKKWKWTQKSDHMILLNENQGVCRAGIKREDLILDNPPVYATSDDENWVLCADTVSEFLSAALAYEAVFAFEFCSDDIYELTGEEFSLIESRLEKYPFEMKNWIDVNIRLYYNDSDNLLAILDGNDDGYFQMFYGASSQQGYEKLFDSIGDIGDEM